MPPRGGIRRRDLRLRRPLPRKKLSRVACTLQYDADHRPVKEDVSGSGVARRESHRRKKGRSKKKNIACARSIASSCENSDKIGLVDVTGEQRERFDVHGEQIGALLRSETGEILIRYVCSTVFLFFSFFFFCYFAITNPYTRFHDAFRVRTASRG